jgi:hypothetical protein
LELFIRRSERWQTYCQLTASERLVLDERTHVPAVAASPSRAAPVVMPVPRQLWAAFRAEAVAQDRRLNEALTAAAVLYLAETVLFVDYCLMAASWPDAQHRGGKRRTVAAG